MAIHIGRRLLTASTIEGTGVQNAAGEDLGEIHSLMIDLEKGRIAHAVLSFGGFLGLGDKLFALPWGALTISAGGDFFILNVPRERLEQAEGTITKAVADSQTAEKKLLFMPGALVPGIEAADPMIAARSASYIVSLSRRAQAQ